MNVKAWSLLGVAAVVLAGVVLALLCYDSTSLRERNQVLKLIQSMDVELAMKGGEYGCRVHKIVGMIDSVESKTTRGFVANELARSVLTFDFRSLNYEERMALAKGFWIPFCEISTCLLKYGLAEESRSFMEKAWRRFQQLCKSAGSESDLSDGDGRHAISRRVCAKKLRWEFEAKKNHFEHLELRIISQSPEMTQEQRGTILRCWHEIKKSIDEREMADATEVNN